MKSKVVLLARWTAPIVAGLLVVSEPPQSVAFENYHDIVERSGETRPISIQFGDSKSQFPGLIHFNPGSWGKFAVDLRSLDLRCTGEYLGVDIGSWTMSCSDGRTGRGTFSTGGHRHAEQVGTGKMSDGERVDYIVPLEI
ncbi:MAG: hypothetical protein AAGJ94_13620 [Pseudomonadota bacterium]